MSNLLMNIFESKANRLDKIERFGGNYFLGSRETISQHSYWVIFFSNWLYENIFPCYVHDSMQCMLLKYALFHDYDESTLWNDVTHPIKYDKEYGAEIRTLLEKIVAKEVKNSSDLFDKEYEKFLNYGKDNLLGKKNYDLVKKICKCADWLSFLKTCYLQTKLGNFELLEPMDLGFRKFQICVTELHESLAHTDVVFDFLIALENGCIEYMQILKINK